MRPGVVVDTIGELKAAIREATSSRVDHVVLGMDTVRDLVELFDRLPQNAEQDALTRLPRETCGDPKCQVVADVHDLATWVLQQHKAARPEAIDDARTRAGQLAHLLATGSATRMQGYLALLYVLVGLTLQIARDAHPEAFERPSESDDDAGPLVH